MAGPAIRREGMARPTRSRLSILVSLALAILSFAALPASASATIQLGVYTPGAPASAGALSDYTAMVGRQPEIVMSYRDFGLPLLYSNEVTNLRATGQTPMVSLEPYQSLSAIAAGEYDSYLHQQAEEARSWGGTLMIRFGHEMNGDWYSWSGSPEAFVAAWRHVVSVFRADGASNVKWVWAPNIQEGSKYPMAPYFPGDEWVDYVGLDGYNWGRGQSWGQWESLHSVFAASYALVTQMSTKPVIITETSSSEAGGDKAAWIRQAFMSDIPQHFPRVSAVIWFNREQEDDWRIDSSSASLDAYRAVVNCSIYGGTGPCDGGVGIADLTEKEKLVVRSVRVRQRVPTKIAGTVSYRLSESAKVRIKVIRRGRPGHRFRVTRKSRKGRNRVPLKRLIRRRKLRVGSYRVVIIARDGEGERTRSRKVHFRVV